MTEKHSPLATVQLEDEDCWSEAIKVIESAMELLPEGGILRIDTKDPIIAIDIAGWCITNDHILLTTMTESLSYQLVQKKSTNTLAYS